MIILIGSSSRGMINSFSKMSEMFCTVFSGTDSISCKVSNNREKNGDSSHYFWVLYLKAPGN